MGHRDTPRASVSGTADVVARMLDRATAASIAETLQALAAPSRLMILATLQAGPRTVGGLVEAVGMEQSAVSHQLRLLRDRGWVAAERHGKSISYRLFDDHVAELIEQALYHAEHLRGATDHE